MVVLMGLIVLPASTSATGPLFGQPGTYAGGGLAGAGFGPSSIASGDFNGDGARDLAVPSWTLPTGLFVHRNLGGGAFSRAQAVGPLVGVGAFAVATADFDRDGDTDLAGAFAGTQAVAILRNRGDGRFEPAGSYPSVGAPHDMVVADLDTDGDADLAVTNPLGGTVTLLLGDGHGRFVGSTVPAPFPTAIATGDFNEDGRPDLVTFGGFGGLARPLFGDGHGSFIPGPPTQVGGVAEGIAVGDVDLDGHLDVVVASAGGHVLVAPGLGDGRFGPPAATSVGAALDVAIADLDDDGTPDLAVTVADGVVVLSGGGAGAFTVAERHAVNAAQSVLVDDLDNDGHPDLAVSTMAPSIAVLLHA